MTALITGVTGFIGFRLMTVLGSDKVRGLVRAKSGLSGAMVGDLLAPISLLVACDGVETVYHCAGYAHAFTSSDHDAHWRVNFEGTKNLVTAAGEAGVKRFIFLSSVKAMAEPGNECVGEEWPGEPETPYGQAKRAAEIAALEAGAKYGMHVVNLRLAMVYGRGGHGNLERMARGIRAGWFPPLPETGNRRSLIHVNDVIDVIRLVAVRPEANAKTYIVANLRANSGREIYDALRAGFGLPCRKWSVPVPMLEAGGMLGDWAGRLLHWPLPMNTEVVDRLLGSACYSPARIEQELGWQAKVGLKDGVREMLGNEAAV